MAKSATSTRQPHDPHAAENSAHFAEGCQDDERLSDVLHKMDEPSLSKLVEDHGRGKLADICKQAA